MQRVERWICDQHVVGSIILLRAKTRNNLGQVVYTYVPLSHSSSSITWYWSTGGDALRLGM